MIETSLWTIDTLNAIKIVLAHVECGTYQLFLFPEIVKGAMKCFTAAISLWLAAVISQIHAEVSSPQEVRPESWWRPD